MEKAADEKTEYKLGLVWLPWWCRGAMWLRASKQVVAEWDGPRTVDHGDLRASVADNDAFSGK